MARRQIHRARGRSRALRGATLALLAERAGHGYELAHRLNRRLGPTWRVRPRQIYPILDELVETGLATCAEEPIPDRPRQSRVVYRATDGATETLRLWMQSPIEKEPTHPDLLARIASAGPGDAAKLSEALDEYERDLLELLEANGGDLGPVSSWSTLLLSLVRSHTEAQLRGELRWVAESRRRIDQFAIDARSGPHMAGGEPGSPSSMTRRRKWPALHANAALRVPCPAAARREACRVITEAAWPDAGGSR